MSFAMKCERGNVQTVGRQCRVKDMRQRKKKIQNGDQTAMVLFLLKILK